MQNEILRLAETVAKERYNGHFTLLRFTTNWRFCFDTIEFSSDPKEWRENINKMYEGKTMESAILKALADEFERNE